MYQIITVVLRVIRLNQKRKQQFQTKMKTSIDLDVYSKFKYYSHDPFNPRVQSAKTISKPKKNKNDYDPMDEVLVKSKSLISRVSFDSENTTPPNIRK